MEHGSDLKQNPGSSKEGIQTTRPLNASLNNVLTIFRCHLVSLQYNRKYNKVTRKRFKALARRVHEKQIGGSANGRPRVFEAQNKGSIPFPPEQLNLPIREGHT